MSPGRCNFRATFGGSCDEPGIGAPTPTYASARSELLPFHSERLFRLSRSVLNVASAVRNKSRKLIRALRTLPAG